jgi:sulfur-oxidizing protein SoxY
MTAATFANRRSFLKQCLRLLALAPLWPWANSIAATPASAFATAPFSDTLSQLFDGQTLIDSDQLHITLPAIAENGAVVPIHITSALTGIQRLLILVEKNPTPLAAVVNCSPQLIANLHARIKMAESCQVVVVADCGDSYYKTQQWVTVMQGGCGTG